MSKPKRTPIEAFLSLNDEQKEREYKSVDRAFTRAETQPLNAAGRKAWRKFQERRRAPGRPKVGQGAKTVALTIERGLLKRADALAKREGVSRAQIVARGLKLLLKAS